MTNQRTRRRNTWPVPPLAVGATGLLAALGLLTALEVTGSLLSRPDAAVLSWMLTHRSSHLTSVAVAITNSGTSPLLYPLVAAAGVAVWLRTRRWIAGVVALAVTGAGVLSRLELSKLVGDPRPPQADWLLPVHGYAFPSGHACTSTLVAGSLAWLLTYLVLQRPARLAIGSGLACWALLVAVSRTYLGVHWISDILGSWLLAGTWLLLLPATARRLPADRPTPNPPVNPPE